MLIWGEGVGAESIQGSMAEVGTVGPPGARWSISGNVNLPLTRFSIQFFAPNVFWSAGKEVNRQWGLRGVGVNFQLHEPT